MRKILLLLWQIVRTICVCIQISNEIIGIAASGQKRLRRHRRRLRQTKLISQIHSVLGVYAVAVGAECVYNSRAFNDG